MNSFGNNSTPSEENIADEGTADLIGQINLELDNVKNVFFQKLYFFVDSFLVKTYTSLIRLPSLSTLCFP